MIDNLGANPFKTDGNWFSINGFYKCCITIKLM